MGAIDEYIKTFPELQQQRLEQVRVAIRQVCPEATETISYGIPTFKYGGNLVHFAQAKNHIGLYPGSKAILTFQERLHGYKTSNGAIQLPLDKPLPIDLVQDIVRYCVEEVDARQLAKQKKVPKDD